MKVDMLPLPLERFSSEEPMLWRYGSVATL
jgi:hypothetical protein